MCLSQLNVDAVEVPPQLLVQPGLLPLHQHSCTSRVLTEAIVAFLFLLSFQLHPLDAHVTVTNKHLPGCVIEAK